MTEIKVEDLVKKCEKCGSTGDTANSVARNFPNWGTTSPRSGCDKCHNHGGEMTPTGKALYDFLAWLRYTVQSGIDQ